MDNVLTLEDLQVILGLLIFLICLLAMMICYIAGEFSKLRKRCDKAYKRINLLYEYIQSYVPDGMYVTAKQFLEMHPDFDYFDE